MGPGSVRRRIRAVRGSPASPPRVGIPAPARRYSHLGGSRASGSKVRRPIIHHRQAASQLSFFSHDQELREHRRKPRHGIVQSCSQPSPTRPATASLSLPERAGSSGIACEPLTLPGFGKPTAAHDADRHRSRCPHGPSRGRALGTRIAPSRSACIRTAQAREGRPRCVVPDRRPASSARMRHASA